MYPTPLQIALRTYSLALSLSLGPSLLPFIIAQFPRLIILKLSFTNIDLATLKRILRRELGYDGFAFSMTLIVAGGAAIRDLFQNAGSGIEGPTTASASSARVVQRLLQPFKGYLLYVSPEQQSFISNLISSFMGILLLQAGRARTARLRAASIKRSGAQLGHTSPTLDLTLLLLVRAIDSIVQTFILQKSQSIVNNTPSLGDQPVSKQHTTRGTTTPLETGQSGAPLVSDNLTKDSKSEKDAHKIRLNLTSRLDAFVFWACSARIMWCFFYEPHRLPRSYVKWIKTLAGIDGSLIQILQCIRAGTWSYRTGSPRHGHILQKTAQKLGRPASWGDPSILPAHGGAAANVVWKSIGLHSRSGVGGLPCEVVHGKTSMGMGCAGNTGLRIVKAFLEALVIYLPVHFIPVFLTRPRILLRPHRVLETLLGAFRSATFLSSFVGLCWYSVCFTRTVVLAKLFPFISHDFWDGPFGCIMAGSLMCGSSIWIENGRRRGEMTLYVLPRALRACLPETWVKSGNRGVKVIERLRNSIVFILSMSVLLTAATYRPDSLRGLSRWTLAFVTNGPNAGFWKRRRRDPSNPPTPPTSFIIPENYDNCVDTPKLDN